MMEWGEFLLALSAFLLAHVLPARPGLRDRIIHVAGERAYLVAYSLISILLLGWLIVATGRAPFVPIWAYAPWQAWGPALVMPLVCLLIAFGAGAVNPLSFGGRTGRFDPARPGIAGVTRHPLLWALALWAGAHLLPNGNLAHVLMFGLFASFALVGMVMIDRRRRRHWGAQEWARMARETSLVPLAALVAGRWRPARGPSLWRLMAGAALYAVLLVLHGPVIGVSPYPVW